MKSSIRNFVLRYKLLNYLYRSFVTASTRRSMLESERRKSLSIFDYKHLAQPIEKNHYFLASENNIYGTGRLLDQIEEVDPKNSVVEHGFIFGSFVSSAKAKSWAKTLVTFSDYRRGFLQEKTKKHVVCVGPYIHYFSSLLTEKELVDLKTQLGTVLLVFPSHSLNDVNINYNKREFNDTINEISKDYDTVLICLYWADILKGAFKEYLNSKVKIVTAGHIYDRYFLNRLRSIIELSDFVFSNSVGTHVGYSIYLKKPIYLLKQETKYELTGVEHKQRNLADHLSKDVLIDKLFMLFNNKNKREITDEQYDFVSELFGFKYVKEINQSNEKTDSIYHNI